MTLQLNIFLNCRDDAVHRLLRHRVMKTSERKSYKIKSIRIPEYDYSTENYYFVTICSFQKQKIFSEIKNGNIYLTEIGKIIKDEWSKTEQIRDNAIMDDFVIMPNHIHGIIVLNSKVCAEKTTRRVVSTTLKPSSLGSIIGQIKSITTKRIRKLTNNPEIKIWQPRFYEHIIRNDKELFEVRTYIKNNPVKWSEDEYYF
jgi:putative transposase